MIEIGRRLMVAACIGLLGLVLAIGLAAGSGGASAACASPCRGGGASVAAPGPHSSIPCLRDAACSGGFVLGAGGGFTVALAVPAAIGALALAVTRIRRSRVRRGARGRLVDGGLFRPPRIHLGI